MWRRCLYLHWSLVTIGWNVFLPTINTSEILRSPPQDTLITSSSQINVTCAPEEPPGLWESDRVNPSVLHDLRVKLISTEKGPMLNISWAVKVDATIRYLVGLQLDVETRDRLWCQYNPPFNTSDISVAGDELWFSYLEHADPDGDYSISAHNIPEPPYGSGMKIQKHVSIETPGCEDDLMMSHSTCKHTGTISTTTTTPSTIFEVKEKSRAAWMVVLITLTVMVLFTIGMAFYCKRASTRFSKITAESDLTTVLIVYPAVDSVFQRAVLTLADFLQSSGVCSVAIDVWQRGRLAELGPLRWLHTISESTDQVLIVLPGHATSLDKSVGKLLPSSQVGHTVPASAYELYPLALKMLSHSKMWVVHLGKAATKSNMPMELRGCRSFTLLEDLQKLLHSLSTRLMATGPPRLRSWLGMGKQKNWDTAADKLKEVVEQLEQWEQMKDLEETLQVVTV